MKRLLSSKIILFLIITSSFVMLLGQTSPTHAYTTCDGVETGDSIVANYKGEFKNGTIFDSKDGAEFTISPDAVIQGFYENVRGMKIGEQKEFTVLPSKGYEDPNHELHGETLVFWVEVVSVKGEVVECEDNGSNFGSILLTILKWTAGIGAFAFVGMTLYFQSQKQTKGKCVHCKKAGRSTIAQGTCKKCGNKYCRDSFGKGCPNCGSNTFVPFDKRIKPK